MDGYIDCCCLCRNYVDALCIVTDEHDDESPETFKCQFFVEDIDED